ncbi:FecCD transport family [Acididesulfobacillus acetoxydans]|uniref:Cobalamin import system permease protein BtuC n=2 Tax=Acididesulfobacillus acetoxydans TaxID=1561005 RepID=A0A8S0WVY3_9FIRM|nr:FecCD transport family [Acididesulfobacillus acetoxydans]CEJ07967.1 Cobalamin import system permease protein BtuC [Acididesulfobacillus acetoxydans]
MEPAKTPEGGKGRQEHRWSFGKRETGTPMVLPEERDRNTDGVSGRGRQEHDGVSGRDEDGLKPIRTERFLQTMQTSETGRKKWASGRWLPNWGQMFGRKEVILLLSLLVSFFLSFPLGRYGISPWLLLKVLAAKVFPLRHTWPATVDTVVFEVRLPRILAAMAVGAALSASGAAYQGMFKNPLVSPDILGASAGAAFGAALAIYYSWNITGIEVSAFLFGLMAVLLAYYLSRKIRHDPMLALVLAGILIGTLFTSFTSLIKYLADPYDKLPAITFWLMGSLAAVTPKDIATAAVPMFIGGLPLYLLRWRINVLSLGDEEAQALGLETGRLRLVVILCSTLMTAAAVSISGLVGWVGLIVPHLARMIVGPNYKVLLPASLFLGGAYLLLVDDLARTAASVEIPLGILTSLIGAPFFIYLLLRSKRGWG